MKTEPKEELEEKFVVKSSCGVCKKDTTGTGCDRPVWCKVAPLECPGDYTGME